MISGAQLKDHVRSVLMSRGLDSRPVISDNRRFRVCQSPLEVTPMFGGYKTVRLTCPDADGSKLLYGRKLIVLLGTRPTPRHT